MDKNNSIIASSGHSGQGQTIEPLSPTMNMDLTPAQTITGMGVPLSGFDNSAIDDLQRDVFWAIYLANPVLKEVPPSGREEVRGLLEWVLRDPSFKPSMLLFTNFKMPSAMAAYSVTEELMEMDEVMSAMRDLAVADMMDEQADKFDQQADQQECEGDEEQEQPEDQPSTQPQDSPEQAQDEPGAAEGENPTPDTPQDQQEEQEQGEGDEEGEGQGEADSDQPFGDDKPDPDELRDRAQDMRDRAQQKRQEAQEKLNDTIGDSINDFHLKGAIGTGQDLGEDVISFMHSWGLEEGDPITLSPDKLRQIMDMLSVEGMANLTSLIRRVRGVAAKTIEGRAPVQVAVDQAGLTKSVLDLDPASRYKLSEYYPYRDVAVRDFLKDGLPGIVKTMQAKSEGAFIALCDESSSMEWPVNSNQRQTMRKEVSKALSLGLAQSAKKNGQPFRLAGFGSTNQFTEIMDQNTPIDKLMEWAIFEFNGGTNFDYAFDMMFQIVDGLDSDERYQTDYLMITDGKCGIEEGIKQRIQDEKDDYGARFFLLLIGDDVRARDDIFEVVDEVIDFSDLDTASETLANLIWF